MILSREEDTSGIAPRLLEGGPMRGLYWAMFLTAAFIIFQLALSLVVGLVALVLVMATPITLADAANLDSGFAIATFAALEFLLFCLALFCAMGFRPLSVGLTFRGAGHSALLLAPLVGLMAWIVSRDPSISVRAALSSEVLGWILLLCICIGLAEELIFRGLMVGLLGGRSAPLFAAVMSGLVFGLVHLFGQFQHSWFNPDAFVHGLTIAGLCGIPFAVVYLRTGSLVTLIAVHAAWDALIFGSLTVSESFQGSGTGSGSEQLFSSLTLPLVVSVGYLGFYAFTDRLTLRRMRDALRPPRPRTSVDWDALAEDEIVNPWVKAQLQRAASR